MEAFLRNLFATNEVVLVAVYGQAFFVLGLSVALQWRRESRLPLARSVPLLAAFGLIKSFAIWGDIFIPVQASYLAAPDIELLRLLQLLLMLTGFAFLLHFGIRLNWDNAWTPRVPWTLAAIGATFLIIAFMTGIPTEVLRLRFEEIVRPFFVFTGALLAAWGLRGTAAQIEAMNLPRHIVAWLRIAGIAFGAYAIFGGLLVPWSLEQVRSINLAFFGIPYAVPRLLAIAVLAWAMIQALTIFRLELQRAMEEMGRLRALSSDRQRIGRELHDGTIQAIYGAGLLLENAAAFLRSDAQAAASMIQETMSLLNRTIGDVRRYIFELSDGEGQLAESLGILVQEMQNQCKREIEYQLSGQIPRVSPEHRGHLLQIAREAITNAVKHSEGSEIVVALRGESDALVLTVMDNGRGLPPGGAFRPGGRGVPNLRARAALLGGTLRMTNRTGGGLAVEVVMPYQEETTVTSGNGKVERIHEASTDFIG